MNRKSKVSLVIFILVTLGCGWLGVGIDQVLVDQPEGNSLGMGIWLVLPFLTSIILRIVGHDKTKVGIRLNLRKNLVEYGVSIGIMPAITILLILGTYLLGGLEIEGNLNTAYALIISAAAGYVVKNIFEEFSWRGYLVPKLIETGMNDWLIYLISGLVWALWHTAYYMVFLPDSLFETTSRVGTIFSGCINMVSWSIVFVELYRITESVWPCIILHTLQNAVPTTLITTEQMFKISEKLDFWFNPEFGVCEIGIMIMVGLILRHRRIQKK